MTTEARPPKKPVLTEGEKHFAQYLEESSIFICDSSSASRTRLAKTLVDLGARASKINLISNFDFAMNELEKSQPRVILTDYMLGGGSGFDLLKAFREKDPQSKDHLHILITGNSSQSAVAQAAEEDIDTYIVKPYTLETLRRTLTSTAVTKFFPSDYMKTIHEGKEFLVSGDVAKAIEIFGRAKSLSPSPTLACFYLGQSEALRQEIEGATTYYSEGLQFNKIHYKCLTGLYDIFHQQQRWEDAYAVVKRISQYFPSNPKRLASVLRLAIITRNYGDIETYYKAFTELENRTDELVKYMCAALVVCGKHYLMNRTRSRAIELFEKVAVSCAGRTNFLKKVIENLCEFKYPKDAVPFLQRFPIETHNDLDYLVSQFLILDATEGGQKAIQVGRELIDRGVQDPAIHSALIRRSRELGMKEMADAWIFEAVRLWPAMAGEFSSMIAKDESRTSA